MSAEDETMPAREETQPAPEAQPAAAEAASSSAPPPEKKQRGKPKDANAPPKPKSGFQQFTGEARKRLKEERPELATDLKGMGIALAEEWAKVPQEEKDRLTAVYEKEMVVWRPKWAAYKQTRQYKDFVEVKTDWLDMKAQKKLQKKMNSDAPKRPKSGYMIFGSEIREQVMEKVKAEGLGLGDAGRIISDRWSALSEAEKARYGEMSADQKKVFDVEFAKYRKTQQFKDFMEAKAKLTGKQGLKKITRTCLDEAPKKATSAFGLFRNEVMPGLAEENQKAPPETKLDMAAFARKVAGMWQALTDEEKKPYQDKAAGLRTEWEKSQAEFKTSSAYTQFLEKREKIKSLENRQLHLREMPKRPKSVFALFAEDRKDDVQPGKGEGKGRSALKDLWEKTAPEERKKYEDKEKELKDIWLKELAEYKAGEHYQTFEKTAQKVKKEFATEAEKVTAMKFLKEAPKPPPKSSFSLYMRERRKRPAEEMEEEAPAKALTSSQLSKSAAAGDKTIEVLKPEGFCVGDRIKVGDETHVLLGLEPMALKKPLASGHPEDSVVAVVREAAAKKAKNAESAKAMEDWRKLDREIQQQYDVRRKDLWKAFEEQCKEFMQSDRWKEYVSESKRMKIPVRSLLLHKKKVIKKLAKGMKQPPSSIPLPSRPETWPQKAKNALQLFSQEMRDKVDTLEEISEKWKAMDDEGRQPYVEMAAKAATRYAEEMEDFKASDEGKAYLRALNVANRRRRILGAKNKYLDDLPKKPQGAIPTFTLERTAALKKDHPGKKGFELKKMVQEEWAALDNDGRQKWEDEAKERMKEYDAALAAFKQTDNWKNFQKAMKTRKPVKKMANGKPNPASIQIPSKPESFPDANVKQSAAQIYAKEQKALGVKIEDVMENWKALDSDGRQKYNEAAAESIEKYEAAKKAFNESKEGKSYFARLKGAQKRKRQLLAENKYLGDMPKKPIGALEAFTAERLPALKLQHTGKTGAEVKKLLMDEWNDENPEKARHVKEHHERVDKYNEDMAEFKKSDKWKSYLKATAIKKMIKPQKGSLKNKKPTGPVAPVRPNDMPKKPLGAYQDFCKTQSGKSLGQLAAAWKELDEEKKKEFEAAAQESNKKYEEELRAFMRTADGKKYNRELAAFKKKQREVVLRKKFFSGEDAPQEPKRPLSAYFLFVQEARSSMAAGLKAGELAQAMTKKWNELEPEKKKEIEDKAKEMKEKYDKDMAEYRASPAFQKYNRAMNAVSGKQAQQRQAQAKAKATAKAKAAAGAGRGGGGGRGRGAARAPAAAASKADADDSGSDVMGSDSDDSSSNSDSD